MRQATSSLLRCIVAVALLGGLAVAGCTHFGPEEPAANVASSITCPQPRTTERAPESYSVRVNPLPATPQNIERGRRLFELETRPDCAGCHGVKGNGQGPAGIGLVPPPRDFTCTVTMTEISDGQIYWIIEKGSGDFHLPSRQGAQQVGRPARGRPASMRGYGDRLTETDIWQLVLYIRSLGEQDTAAAHSSTNTTTPESAQ
jgi:mono/diheme cytochrome c family protein